jgi:hypothetical protein
MSFPLCVRVELELEKEDIILRAGTCQTRSKNRPVEDRLLKRSGSLY